MIVYKYKLNPGWNSLQLPGNVDAANRGTANAGCLLDVDFQGDTLVMWALVDPERETNMRMFYCAMTGQTIPTDTYYIGEYIGTATSPHGIVVHVFSAHAREMHNETWPQDNSSHPQDRCAALAVVCGVLA